MGSRPGSTLSTGRRSRAPRSCLLLEVGLSDRAALAGPQGGEQVHDPGDDPRPAGLVAGAEAGPVVAVEVLVEEEAIAPVRVLLELPGAAEDGPPALPVPEERVRQAAADLLGDLEQVHAPAGAGGAFHGELGAEVAVVVEQRPDDQA